ncbi:YggU family protein [Desulfofundulus sp. TPOSR]|jgi:hypothetical protein|uniref:UPF0235 protein Desku_1188 n=1 Tax=Desulfofundulus kuznetsovii (strain DSM 6115 / VKM B-1805 / 17) TaxID=760568 RepID=A0AAU8PMB5_DESK7|nr:DUF167 domain-containing protein [Desulfofundulus sp. TPOSR]AEG14772.1 UPF0235 protein yggU [Desulfofundulus kuznetsovii DSM 6115]NHM25792.1 YggU family protein [Desulfofundulus sp. TPOSR]
MIFLREEKGAVVFKVRVQPRAARNELAGVFEDALKVRLTAPPVEGEANEACRDFFARLLGVPRVRVEIIAGHTGRNKLVRVQGVTVEQVRSLMAAQR